MVRPVHPGEGRLYTPRTRDARVTRSAAAVAREAARSASAAFGDRDEWDGGLRGVGQEARDREPARFGTRGTRPDKADEHDEAVHRARGMVFVAEAADGETHPCRQQLKADGHPNAEAIGEIRASSNEIDDRESAAAEQEGGRDEVTEAPVNRRGEPHRDQRDEKQRAGGRAYEHRGARKGVAWRRAHGATVGSGGGGCGCGCGCSCGWWGRGASFVAQYSLRLAALTNTQILVLFCAQFAIPHSSIGRAGGC